MCPCAGTKVAATDTGDSAALVVCAGDVATIDVCPTIGVAMGIAAPAVCALLSPCIAIKPATTTPISHR